MAKSKTTGDSESAGLLGGRGPQLAAAGVLALLAFGAWQAMLSGNQRVAADPRYRVTAESIAVSP
ncbi:MAG: hypothetical protein AAF596_08245, partial [Planctomycetota bacterium]